MLDERIYKNFEALRDYFKQNTDEVLKLYEKKEYSKNIKFYDLEKEEFFRCFDDNIILGIDDNYYEQLDEFLYETLNEYPQLFPKIALSPSNNNIVCLENKFINKNLHRGNEAYNEKLKKNFLHLIKYVKDENYELAAEELLKKKPLRTEYKINSRRDEVEPIKFENERKKIELYYQDPTLSDIDLKLQNLQSKTMTHANLKKDLQVTIQQLFPTFSKEIVVDLSRYMADEIYLRTLDYDHYIYDYIDHEESELFNKELHSIKLEKIIEELKKLKAKNISPEYFWDNHI